MLVLHIGLPKTGTTFLQYQILRRSKGVRLIHRGDGPAEAALCAALQRLGGAGPLGALWQRRRVTRGLARLTAGEARPVVVSDENVSVWSTQFWRGRGPTPEGLAARIVGLGLAEPPRVVIGIRRQDQWLGSRYAESAKHFPDFSQTDFERRLAAIASAPRLDGPLGWLDYDAVRRTFAAALGAERVLLMPLERLASAQGETLDRLGGFLGGVRLARMKAAPGGKPRRRNTLAAGENAWRMRDQREAPPLTLPPELAAAVRARFAASNRALAAELPVPWEA